MEYEKKVLDALKGTSVDGKKKTMKDLTEELGLNRATVTKYITGLISRGAVGYEEYGPTKVYYLEKKSKEEAAEEIIEEAELHGYAFSVSKEELINILKNSE